MIDGSMTVAFTLDEVALLMEFHNSPMEGRFRVFSNTERMVADNLEARKIVEIGWQGRGDALLPLTHTIKITPHGELMMAVYELGIQIRNLMNRRF